ncbi:hypothetical protein WJX72_010472 [[Myrmecia] bisecta]|uniref:Methyltransferase type 11 domain-containing protein n=1 Tax=[Myrmecia] bisecta TaxID=41462 RepID=A0AAW1QTN3_9CHLO
MALAGGPLEVLFAPIKKALFGTLTKQNGVQHIVEIGLGTGPNLRYYEKGIKITGVEPNPAMNDLAEAKRKDVGHSDVTLFQGFAEDIPLPDDCCDAVVCTLVLCSVADPAKCLSESWVTPVWSHTCDGCHLDRDTEQTLKAAGFAKVDVVRGRMPLRFFLFHAPHLLPIVLLARSYIYGTACV